MPESTAPASRPPVPSAADVIALRLHEAQWHGVLETASEAIVTVDRTQTVVSANAAAGALFGVAEEALIGTPAARWVPERHREADVRELAGFIGSDLPARRLGGRGDLLVRGADGIEVPVEASISRARANGTQLFTLVLRDLRALRRAEAALRSSEQTLAAAFAGHPVGMAKVDPSTRRFTAVNPAFCRLSGYDEAALLALQTDALEPADDAPDGPRLGALLAGEPGRQAERRLRRRDGSAVWVAVDASVVRDAEGRPQAVLAVVQDVDARRAGEIELLAREARQAFLLRLNDALRPLADPQAIVAGACRLLGGFTGAARVGYAEDDGDGEHITLVHHHLDGVSGILGRYRYDDYGPALLQAFRAGRTAVRPDIAADPALTAAEKAAHAALQIGASVNVPLLKEGRIHAVFFVHARTPRAWTPEDVALYEEVAERIRADLERARAEARLRAAKATLETALESMTDAVLIADAQGGAVEFNAAFVRFHRFASRAEVPRSLQAYLGLMQVTARDGRPLPLAEWAVPRALRGETATDVEYGLRRVDSGVRWTGSYSFAPLRADDGRVTGAVVVGRDITELRRMQARLQAAHAELQRLSTARVEAQEDERRRIARELHDDLQQSLATIAIDAATAVEDLMPGQAAASDTLRDIVRIAEQAIASTRRIVHDLRPQVLEDLGLAAALEGLARQFRQRTHIDCRVDVGGLPPATAGLSLGPLGTSLYRMAQEALNNVGKHAQARAVTIALAEAPGSRLRLTVEDDGRGMEPRAPRAPEAYGLLGMRERVRAAGGTLAIDSGPGRGTRVAIEVPLPPEP